MLPAGKRVHCRREPLPAPKGIPFPVFRSNCSAAGYSLIEVVVAVGVMALVYGMVLNSYIQSGIMAQWSGYSLAAQSLSVQQIEQARAASWDPANNKNFITNIFLLSRSNNISSQTWTGYATNILDVPYAGTNVTMATNFVTIQYITLNNDAANPVYVYMIRVDTVWPFFYGNRRNYYTNTTATYFAPDNRQL